MNPRLAEIGDVDAVTALTNSAYAKYVDHLGFEPKPMVTDHEGWIRNRHVWVLGDPGALFGAIMLLPDDEAMMIYSIAIDPARQGEGHGRALMGFAEDQARVLGLSRLMLYTNEKMTDNIAFYHKLSYEQYGRQQHENHPDSWVIFMRKEI
jgi:GNAT superfamily N-acetyltransferase